MRFLLLVLSVVAVASCQSVRSVIPPELTDENLEIPIEVRSVTISDKRTGISRSEDIHLPFLSMPNQRINHFPAVSQKHAEIIKYTVETNSIDDSDDTFDVVVEILHAEKEFSATFSTERETTRVMLKLIFKGDSGLYYSGGMAEFTISSIDAKYKRFEELYLETLRFVTYKALEEFRDKYKGNIKGRYRI